MTTNLTKLERIDAVIQRTNDLCLLRLLNRAWWREWFQTDEYERFLSVHTMDESLEANPSK